MHHLWFAHPEAGIVVGSWLKNDQGSFFFCERLPVSSRGLSSPYVSHRLVVVFQCYLDDSGTSGLPIITMAGFAATCGQWEQMEASFNDVLDRHEVPILHAKEYHDTKGCFGGWSRIRKRSFTEELFGHAHGRMVGISVTARKQAFEEARKTKPGIQSMSPYGFCFSAILMKLMTHSQVGPHIRKLGLAFLVETGNRNNGEIEKRFHNLAQMPIFEGALKSISFIPKGHCRAIQVADFLAFYSRRWMRNHDRFSGSLALPSCPQLEIIERYVPVLQHGATSYDGPYLGRLDDIDDIEDLTRQPHFPTKQSS